jgi:hypothetical protein
MIIMVTIIIIIMIIILIIVIVILIIVIVIVIVIIVKVIVIAVTSYLTYVSPWVGLLFLEKKYKLFKCVFLSNYKSKGMCMHLIKYIENHFF